MLGFRKISVQINRGKFMSSGGEFPLCGEYTQPNTDNPGEISPDGGNAGPGTVKPVIKSRLDVLHLDPMASACLPSPNFTYAFYKKWKMPISKG